MNKQQVKGAANQAKGEIKQQVGKMTGDNSTRVRGHASEAKGKLQKGMGDARQEVNRDDRELRREREAGRSRR